MSQAKNGDTVKVHYTCKSRDGKMLGGNIGEEPLKFTIGKNQVIPGFEQAVIGMGEGESKTAKVSPDDAFGPRLEEKLIKVNRNQLPENMEVKVGQELEMKMKDGIKTLVRVADVSESKVTLDTNHPLAGKELTFDINLVEVTS